MFYFICNKHWTWKNLMGGTIFSNIKSKILKVVASLIIYLYMRILNNNKRDACYYKRKQAIHYF